MDTTTLKKVGSSVDNGHRERNFRINIEKPFGRALGISIGWEREQKIRRSNRDSVRLASLSASFSLRWRYRIDLRRCCDRPLRNRFPSLLPPPSPLRTPIIDFTSSSSHRAAAFSVSPSVNRQPWGVSTDSSRDRETSRLPISTNVFQGNASRSVIFVRDFIVIPTPFPISPSYVPFFAPSLLSLFVSFAILYRVSIVFIFSELCCFVLPSSVHLSLPFSVPSVL